MRYAEKRFIIAEWYAKANLSTKEKEKGKNARFSRAYGNQEWPHRPQATAGKGPQEINRFVVMLSRVNRLSEKRDFQRVFARGRGATTPLYAVRWNTNTVGCPRFGFVVANTISKKATRRNLIRRRLREAVRKNLASAFPSVDVVIIAKPKLLTTLYRELEPIIVRSLKIIAGHTRS